MFFFIYYLYWKVSHKAISNPYKRAKWVVRCNDAPLISSAADSSEALCTGAVSSSILHTPHTFAPPLFLPIYPSLVFSLSLVKAPVTSGPPPLLPLCEAITGSTPPSLPSPCITIRRHASWEPLHTPLCFD